MKHQRQGSSYSSPQIEGKGQEWGVEVIPIPEPQCCQFTHAYFVGVTGKEMTVTVRVFRA